jgi:hypothetical protein
MFLGSGWVPVVGTPPWDGLSALNFTVSSPHPQTPRAHCLPWHGNLLNVQKGGGHPVGPALGLFAVSLLPCSVTTSSMRLLLHLCSKEEI